MSEQFMSLPMSSMDTSPEAEAVLFERFRQMTVEEKLIGWQQSNQMARRIAFSGLKERYPDASQPELERRLAGLLPGEDLATKAYGAIEALHAEC